MNYDVELSPHKLSFSNIQKGIGNKYIQIIVLDKTDPLIVEAINKIIRQHKI